MTLKLLYFPEYFYTKVNVNWLVKGQPWPQNHATDLALRGTSCVTKNVNIVKSNLSNNQCNENWVRDIDGICQLFLAARLFRRNLTAPTYISPISCRRWIFAKKIIQSFFLIVFHSFTWNWINHSDIKNMTSDFYWWVSSLDTIAETEQDVYGPKYNFLTRTSWKARTD